MSARILFFDIETAPLEVYAWRTGDQHVGIEQIKEDWSIMSWAAKWLGQDRVMYQDLRKSSNPRNDKPILKGLWNLLNECDVVVTQNGISFDSKKVNARFIQSGMQPPSSYKHVDILRIKRKVFGFTSNKMAYTSSILNENYKKLEHEKFPGLKLWKECLAGNLQAWKEMEKYNKYDVLTLEEEYNRLMPWDSSTNFAIYNKNPINQCTCGNKTFFHNGFHYTPTGKYQRFRCSKCGKEGRHSKNLISKDARKQLLRRV